MTLSPLNKPAGTRKARHLPFAQKPQGGAMVALTTELFMPKTVDCPAPLLIWLGADALSDRAVNPKGPQRLAEILTRKGVALAAPRLRTTAEEADLPDATIEALSRLAPQKDPSADPDLCNFAAIAATEDVCALMEFVARKGAEFGLSGQVVLAGASMGAGLAFNVAVAAPHLGLKRPDPVGVLSYSGTCAWPSLYEPDRLRVFALHNPTNTRMPIGPIRAMADGDPLFELVESMEQAHGSLGLWPEETALQALTRIQTRVMNWCAD